MSQGNLAIADAVDRGPWRRPGEAPPVMIDSHPAPPEGWPFGVVEALWALAVTAIATATVWYGGKLAVAMMKDPEERYGELDREAKPSPPAAFSARAQRMAAQATTAPREESTVDPAVREERRTMLRRAAERDGARVAPAPEPARTYRRETRERSEVLDVSAAPEAIFARALEERDESEERRRRRK